MNRKQINSKNAPVPQGGYSQAVLVDGASKMLFMSGQIPETAGAGTPVDFESQCRLVWANISAQLETAGMTISDLIKVTTFLSSREYAEINSMVRQEFLGSHKPALTAVITRILDERWLLEIEAIAAQ